LENGGTMSNCLFCKIVKGEIPADIVDENDVVMAFNDINPMAPTHVLIIPRDHISTTLDISEENKHLLGEMALMAQKIAVKKGLDSTGYRWVINTGKDGGQAVYHIHLHLLGGRQLNWPPG